MQNNTETKVWNATLYLRLSRDDGDKEESNSITGQRELLRDFIECTAASAAHGTNDVLGATVTVVSESSGAA